MTIKTKPPNSDRSLAKALGVTHTTIGDWRSKFPGLTPKDYDVTAWQSFMDENGLGGTGNQVSGDREHWLTKQAEYRAKLLEMEEAKERGETISKAELDKRDQRIASAQKAMLYELMTTELPIKSEGKSAVEIRILNRDAADRICQAMQERLGDWAGGDHEE